MGELDNAQWWWEFGLDGVIGGVAGALVTAVAVYLTLRHERRLTALQAIREPLGRVLGSSMNLGVLIATGSGDALEHRQLYMVANAAGWQVTALAARSWPKFAVLVTELLVRLAADVDAAYGTHGDDETQAERRAEVATTTAALVVAATRWLGSPRVYESGSTTSAEELRAKNAT